MKDIIKPKVLLYVCVFIITIIFTFPPWETTIEYAKYKGKEYSGYYFIFSNPQPTFQGKKLTTDGRYYYIGSANFNNRLLHASIAISWSKLFVPAIPVFIFIVLLTIMIFFNKKNDRDYETSKHRSSSGRDIF